MLKVIGAMAGVLIVCSYYPYIRDILLGKTKPERASWLIWAVLGSIAFFSQLSVGGSVSLILPATETVFTSIIFILAVKYGYGGVTRRDTFALAGAALGLALWYLTNNPLIALALVLVVDLIGASLTVMKAYEDPGSETLSSWVLVALGAALSLVSVGRLDWSLLIYPLYIVLANGATALAIVIGRERVNSTNN